MRTRTLVLGALATLLVVCAGLVGALLAELSPEAPVAPPDRRQVLSPAATPAPGPSSAVEGAPGCRVEVLLETQRGAPVAGARLWALPASPGAARQGYAAPLADFSDGPRPTATTGDDGALLLAGLPCGLMRLDVGGPGVLGAGLLHDSRSEDPLHLVLPDQVRVRVRVEDLRGTPVDRAAVTVEPLVAGHPAGETSEPDADGWRVAAVPLDVPVHIEASHFRSGPAGSDTWTAEAEVTVPARRADRLAPGEAAEDVVLVLPMERVVRVRCLGVPGDSCEGVAPIQCTHSLVPLGNVCLPGPVASCVCPPGRAAVRGGGAAVEVPDSADEAWLDLRFGGGITGRVVEDGQPRPCSVLAMRLPEHLEDLPRGGLLGREAACEADGRFHLHALSPGDWHVQVTGDDRQVTTPPVRVRGAVVDLGDVELWSGGGIEGRLVDGVTGEPQAHAPVVAMRVVAGDQRSTPAFDDTDSGGSFRFEGLPPGQWDVFAMTSPFRQERVTVEDGLLTDGVEVRTAEATLLEDNGLSLGTDPDGLLVIERVAPGSPGERSGLVPGDVVAGVTVLGFDSTSLPPQMSEKLAAGLLGHWGGPGVGLVIDRDGVLMDVDLD